MVTEETETLAKPEARYKLDSLERDPTIQDRACSTALRLCLYVSWEIFTALWTLNPKSSTFPINCPLKWGGCEPGGWSQGSVTHINWNVSVLHPICLGSLILYAKMHSQCEEDKGDGTRKAKTIRCWLKIITMMECPEGIKSIWLWIFLVDLKNKSK